MKYILKQFDTELLSFEYVDQGIRGQYCTNIQINKNHEHLLPIGLETTDAGIMSWLKRRIIPKNREYVDVLLAKMGLSHSDTIGIIDICKGLSLIDSYWVVDENFDGKFSDYNLFDNNFKKALSLIAYTGYGSINAKGFTSSPEFTTNGMLKKAWRVKDGNITLYKGGTSGAANTGNEPFSEFYSAQIAQVLGINHINYGLSKWKGNICSTCELFTSKDVSYVQIYNFVKNRPIYEVSTFLKELGDEYYEAFADMIAFDCIICNEDRHYGNFGLLVDNATNKPISFAPVFDNGLSLFNFGMPDDFKELSAYAKTRSSSYNIDFLTLAKEFIGPNQKSKLRKLINFKFTKHSSYNLPAYRLKAIEKFVQTRVLELLDM
ncbi:MAG: XRE family transcriptional regulator [Clostridia bacterium]